MNKINLIGGLMKVLLVLVLMSTLFLPFSIEAQELEGTYDILIQFDGCRNSSNEAISVPSERHDMTLTYSKTDQYGTDVYKLCDTNVCNQNTVVGSAWFTDGDLVGEFWITDVTFLQSVSTPGESWGRFIMNEGLDTVKAGTGFAVIRENNYNSGSFTSCRVILN